MRLRTLLIVAAAALVALALGGAATLVALAKAGRESAAYMILSVRSVEVAQQVRLDVARLGAGEDARVENTLMLAATLVQSDDEARIIDNLRKAVGALRGARARGAAPAEVSAAVAAADRAAEELVAINVEQARDAERDLAVRTRHDEAFAITTSVALGLGVIVILLWTWLRLLKPLRMLRDRIETAALGGGPEPLLQTAPPEVRELASRLDAMAKVVEQRRRERLDLLGHVASSMAPPLDGIARIIDALPPTASSNLPALARDLSRLRRVLAEYVDAAHIEEGVLELHRKPVDMLAVLREAIGIFEPLCPAHTFTLTSAAPEAWVDADPERLAQAINNLLYVSIRHAAVGGTVLANLQCDTRTIALAIAASPASSVSFERLFNALHGLDTAFTGLPGSGFTTHTARRVLEAHGGEVEVEQRMRTAVTFTVRLPAARPA